MPARVLSQRSGIDGFALRYLSRMILKPATPQGRVDDKAKPGISKCRALVMARKGPGHSGPTVGQSVVLLFSSPPRVFHSEKITPAARSAKVMPNDQSAGNFSHPIKSATKIFDPMNTSKSDSAYFR